MFQALCISPAHMIIPATNAMGSNSIVCCNLTSPNSNVHLLRHHSQPPQLRSLTAPAIRSSNGTYAIGVKPGQRTSEFFEIEFKVRDYELDRYGVVNNAIYSGYCQHVCDEFLRKLSIDVDVDPQTGTAISFSELSFKFLGPLRSGDKFVVRSRLSACSAACLYFEHFIFKLPNEEAILESRGRAVWLDKNHRPVRIPTNVRSKLLPFVAKENQTDTQL